MSRIGRKEIIIPEQVMVEKSDGNVLVSGPLGKLEVPIHPKLSVAITDNKIMVNRKGSDKLARSVHGLTRTLLQNAIIGVKEGFEKKLEVIGVGYRATLTDGKLDLKIGYSHPVVISAPEGISFEIKKNIICVKGFDKQLVGQVAANIREIKKPEPYKGKGIKYLDEKIIRKVGKAVKGATAQGA